MDVARVLGDLTPEPSPELLGAARWLVRNGQNPGAVLIGLGLLRGRAEQGDVRMLETVGLLSCVDLLAAEVLTGIPDAIRPSSGWPSDQAPGSGLSRSKHYWMRPTRPCDCGFCRHRET